MKIYQSYLALCVAATLHAPQAFAEDPQSGVEPPTNAERIEPNIDLSTMPEDATVEPNQDTQQNSQFESNTVDPVEDISNFYSDMDMRVRLAVKADDKPCSAETCIENKAFDAKVQLIGESLAKSAYSIYPELKKSTPKFEFVVLDKKVLGSASNASGAIVLFRSIQHLDLDDDATAFIIGREMGHVIARHQKSNAKTKIFFTVLTAVLFPAASLISASSAAAQATTATTLMTSAASTVTSFVGSEVALSRIKPSQLSEADDISIALLEYGGVTKEDTAQSLEFIAENENSAGWEKDLNLSIQNVRKLVGEPIEVVAELDPLPDKYVATEADLAEPEVSPEVSVAEPVKMQLSKLQLPTDSQAVESALQQIKPEQKQAEQKPILQKPAEQKPTQQKSVQTKPVEQHKTILITNETLAENRKTKNIIPVKGKLDIKNNLKKATSNIEKTKKDSTRKVATRNTKAKNVKPNKVEFKKSDKLAAKKPIIKPNKAATQVVKKSSKVNTAKVFK